MFIFVRVTLLLNLLTLIKAQESVIYPQDKGDDDPNTVHIGAIFPLHNFTVQLEKGETVHECDKSLDVDGLLALEAFLFTLEEINRDEKILPGITLGGIAMDSCNSPKIASSMALTYIKGYLSSHIKKHGGDFRCPNSGSPVYKSGMYDRVVGVIGGHRSTVSVEMAHMLKLFRIPQISYLSTSVSLSNNDEFPYFLRTVPPDNKQAEVILKLMKAMNWTYSSLVYSSDVYGINGKDELLNQAHKFGICFAEPPLGLSYLNGDARFTEVTRKLLDNSDAGVVVLFAEKTVATLLLKKIEMVSHDHTRTEKLIFIGSDGWTIPPIEKDINSIAENTIAVQPLHQTLPGFEDYFFNLKPSNNGRNTKWFREFWEKHFDCSFTDSNLEKRCNENGNLSRSSFNYSFDWLHFLRDSVYAYAHAIHAMWTTHCNGVPGLCDGLTQEGHVHGSDVLQALKSVKFDDVGGEPFSFDGNRSGSPRYTILQYQHVGRRFTWKPIENYTSEFQPSFTRKLQWHHHSPMPTSNCGEPCGLENPLKIYSKIDRCCWTCDGCSDNQVYNSTEDKCVTCDICQAPSANGTICLDKVKTRLSFRNHWVITATFFSSTGIIISILVAVIFWMHIDTPVIKAASRELSFILLAGIILCFSMTFLIMLPPSAVSCGCIRFLLGFSYTLCYAAILTKTNRIARLFKSPTKVLKARWTSPESQMLIVTFLVGLEVIINIFWLIYVPPEVTSLCPVSSSTQILTCAGIDGYYYLIGLIYPLILVSFCTLYAIKTRKCPGGFNESRYIAFTNYSTCVIWVIFVPLYLTKVPTDETRVVSLALSLSLGGFVQLACLFLPKVHLVLFKPEKNTRDAVMSQQSGGGSRGSNGGRKAAMLHVGMHEGSRGQSIPPPDITMYPYSGVASQGNYDIPREGMARGESSFHINSDGSASVQLQRPMSQQNSSRPNSRVDEDNRVSTYGRGKAKLIKKMGTETVPEEGMDNEAYALNQNKDYN